MVPQRLTSPLLVLTIAFLAAAPVSSFSTGVIRNVNTIVDPSKARRPSSMRRHAIANDDVESSSSTSSFAPKMASFALAAALLAAPVLSPTMPAYAYEEKDYASETVTIAVQAMKDANGDSDLTLKAFENVAQIITEGKGVGGSLNYSGVKLERGFVSDEDTAIYNPGLTLLTESEKERLVQAVVDNRKAGLATKDQWSENNEYAFDFLKQKLDPLHMYELRGYLGILPFYAAAVYLGAFFMQQNSRSIFPAVYAACALAVFGPIIVLVAAGP